jgi:hypothetical protein
MDGGIKMKWNDDPYRSEKEALFDAIIALGHSKVYEDFGNLTVRQVRDCIDNFFDSLIMEREKMEKEKK